MKKKTHFISKMWIERSIYLIIIGILLLNVQWQYNEDGTQVNRDVVLSPAPRTASQNYRFALVSDLDLRSKHDDEGRWHSLLRKGSLCWNETSSMYTLKWHGEEMELSSRTATKGRSMELSELVVYNGKLFAMCDITGIVYRIDVDSGDVFQRWALADGNGKKVKPFKSEWATVKDDRLYIGSIGKEWVTDGVLVHRDPQWVKVVDSHGRIRNEDWAERYELIRRATHTQWPGYLLHEAIEWDDERRQWLVTPRRASTDMYDPDADEHMGTNLLVRVDEHFESAQVSRLGPLEPDWGFTSTSLLPGTGGRHLLTLKAFEVDGHTATRIALFDIDTGESLLDTADHHCTVDHFIDVSHHVKFEGISVY
jgi:soluble calcium-activated nucleotidase 1